MVMSSPKAKAAAVILALGCISSANSFGLMLPVHNNERAGTSCVQHEHVSCITSKPAARGCKASSSGVLLMAVADEGKDEAKAKREVIGRHAPPRLCCALFVYLFTVLGSL